MALSANAQSRFNVALADPTAAREIAAILNAATSAELTFLAGVTAGTALASKALVVDASKDLVGVRDLTTRKVAIGDSANDHTITFLSASNEAANRTLTIPALGGNDTLVILGTAQTLTGAKTFTGGVVVTTTGVTLTDVNIVLSENTGTQIGTAAAQKLAFYGAAPAAQPSAYTQTYATANKTHENPTAATLTVTDGAGTNDNTIDAITDNASTIAAVQELADEINKLVADVADVKQIVNSVIDDLQALGLVA